MILQVALIPSTSEVDDPVLINRKMIAPKNNVEILAYLEYSWTESF